MMLAPAIAAVLMLQSVDRPAPAAPERTPPAVSGAAARPPAAMRPQLAINQMRMRVLCSPCKGEGRVSERVQTGWERDSEWATKRPIMTTVDRECGSCKGSGFGPSEQVWKLMTDVARAMAALKADDPKRSEIIDQLREVVQDCFSDRVPGLADTLEPRIVERLSAPDVPYGEPFVAIIVGSRDFAGGASEGRLIAGEGVGRCSFLTDFQGRPTKVWSHELLGMEFIVRRAKVINFRDGDAVLIGGTLTKADFAGDDRPQFVLEGGFALRIGRPPDDAKKP
jgi:hypothetical protein